MPSIKSKNKILPMDKVWVEEVIISTIARRGKGIEHDPIRVITQIFSKSGELIAEYDPQMDEVSNLQINVGIIK